MIGILSTSTYCSPPSFPDLLSILLRLFRTSILHQVIVYCTPPSCTDLVTPRIPTFRINLLLGITLSQLVAWGDPIYTVHQFIHWCNITRIAPLLFALTHCLPRSYIKLHRLIVCCDLSYVMHQLIACCDLIIINLSPRTFLFCTHLSARY